MEVKGTGIKTTRDFVKTKFPSNYVEWLKSLSLQSNNLYTDSLNIGAWHNIQFAYYEPMLKISELFYQNDDQKAGDELGRYSADMALNEIYKVFLLVARPHYLMKRAASMMQTYYKTSEIEVTEATKNQMLMKIKKFDGINIITEYRIAGWCARALELCNCSNVSYHFLSSKSMGQAETIIEFKWE